MSKQEKLDLFKQVSIDYGCYINSNLELKVNQNNEISVFLKKDIQTNEPLIRVPKDFLITKHDALQYFNLHGCMNRNPNALTQLFLCHLKFNNSEKWASYIELLPSIDAFKSPLLWNGTDLEVIRGSDLYLRVKRTLVTILDEWYSLLKELNLNDTAVETFYRKQDRNNIFYSDFTTKNSFGNYVWASLIFRSRAFPSILLGSSKNLEEAFLYPVVDLLNHKNGTKVAWRSDTDYVNFSSFERMEEGSELFNNYGDKSNEELLLNYGFVETPNAFDIATLTLKFPSDIISNALSFGITIDGRSLVDDAIIFELSNADILPANLVELFSFICKLTSEDKLTVRSTLEGLDKLGTIILQKNEFFKQKINKIKGSNYQHPKFFNVKGYFTGQKLIFQRCLDQIQILQKSTLKKYKPISFKTILKIDKLFSDNLLKILGVTSYDALIKNDLIQQALLLWVVKQHNSSMYKGKLDIPSFISDTFTDVQNSILIEKSDVVEYLDFYKSFFPKLSQKLPEVFGVGSWSIKDFIVAGTVIDRLVWKRPSTSEPFFLLKQEYEH